MFNLDNELKIFNSQIESLKSKKFNTFYEMECEYCKIINLGNNIRNYIIQNPSLCTEQSFKVLTNQTNDLSLLEEKYKGLLNVIFLTKNLFDKYSLYVERLKNEHKYVEAINVYQQMFNLSQDYKYKQHIANIKFKIFNNIEESSSIYKSIEKYLYENKDFWWQFSYIYKAKFDIYNQVLCIKKALDLEED